jgi:fructokinase
LRRSLWHDGLKVAVLTLGRQGSILLTPHGERHVPSIPVTAVDTTGAGDGFVAGFLAGLLEQHTLDDEALVAICRFANAVGAIATTERGAIPALPTRERVEAALRQQDG